MRFLIDTNLPPALAVWLRDRSHISEHAAQVLGPQADDYAIWNYAVANQATVLTRDQDFLDIAMREGRARVVLLRCGNLKLGAFRGWIETRWPSVERLLAEGETVVEMR